jgi:hypothetical protein
VHNCPARCGASMPVRHYPQDKDVANHDHYAQKQQLNCPDFLEGCFV